MDQVHIIDRATIAPKSKNERASLLQVLLVVMLAVTPFEAMGVKVGNYIFSPPVIVGGLASLMLFATQNRYPRTILVYVAMLLWFLVTCVGRYEPSSYLLSFSALVLMSYPVVVLVPSQKMALAMMGGVRFGVLVTLTLITLDLAGQFIGIVAINEFFDLIFPLAGKGIFMGYERPHGGMTEPAHLAIYLVMAIACLDIAGKTHSSNERFKYAAVAGVLLIGSFSGILLLSAYTVIRFGGYCLSDSMLRRRFKQSMLVYAGGIFGLMMLAIITWHNLFIDAWGEYASRSLTVFDVVSDMNFEGSEGSRANALQALWIYWHDQGVFGFLFGTGYANYEGWLLDNFGYLNPILSSFARGQINNILAVVGISTGAIGIWFYIWFLMRVLANAGLLKKPAVLVLVFGFHMAYGGLIAHLFWHMLLALVTALQLERGSVFNSVIYSKNIQYVDCLRT